MKSLLYWSLCPYCVLPKNKSIPLFIILVIGGIGMASGQQSTLEFDFQEKEFSFINIKKEKIIDYGTDLMIKVSNVNKNVYDVSFKISVENFVYQDEGAISASDVPDDGGEEKTKSDSRSIDQENFNDLSLTDLLQGFNSIGEDIKKITFDDDNERYKKLVANVKSSTEAQSVLERELPGFTIKKKYYRQPL